MKETTDWPASAGRSEARACKPRPQEPEPERLRGRKGAGGGGGRRGEVEAPMRAENRLGQAGQNALR
eukprot:8406487-Pyramimonas_sp.AAC.1